MELVIFLAVLAAAGIGVAIWFSIRYKADGKRIQNARGEAKSIITQAEEEKRKALLATQEEVLKLRTTADNDIKEQRQELNQLSRRYQQREENLERKSEALDKQQHSLATKEAEAEQALIEIDGLKGKHLQALEEVAGITSADAKRMVLTRGEEEAKHDLARQYNELEKEFKVRADENARRIVTLAINRLATDVVSETTTSIVSLPNDEMKGRLIGREGRNIRALEAYTGVDVIIDDTPEVVTHILF